MKADPPNNQTEVLDLSGAAGATGRGQLNPTWVEWLMGWPLGWTDCEPLATGRFHEWQLQHSSFCASAAAGDADRAL